MRTPLRVAVLCSRRAPGLAHLLASAASARQPWAVVCCLTSDEACDEPERLHRAAVPLIDHPVRRFYGERDPGAPLRDMRLRAEYDGATLEQLRPFEPDIVLLAGYLLVLTEPMLSAYPARIFNVHHSDLLQSGPDGGPLYPGLRAVRDAILAGERETRATSHVVTGALDDGPPVVRSAAFPVPQAAAWAIEAGQRDLLRAIVWAHQEWMLRAAFGPLMAATLDLAAEGAIDGTVRELDEVDTIVPRRAVA